MVRGESAADLLDQVAPSGASAAAPGVQRRSPPGAQPASDAAEQAEEHADTHAADEIESILDRPSPIAGVGDPTQSLRALEALPLATLLVMLDELEARGRLSEIRQAMEYAPVRTERIRTALLVRDLARLPSVSADAAPLAELAMALEALPHDEMHAAFRYMGRQRSLPRSVRMMIEGFLATESADALLARQRMGNHRQRPGAAAGAPGAAAGSLGARGTGMPAPIGPGPWAPPGEQWPAVYIGNEAHKGIGKYYERMHPGEVIRTNFIRLSTILEVLIQMGIHADSAALSDAKARWCRYRFRRPSARGKRNRHPSGAGSSSR